MISAHHHTRRGILVWSSLFILLLFFSVLLTWPAARAESTYHSLVGTTYYVNANAGSDNNSGTSTSNAFRTLNHAAAQTNPGDTVLVMDGTYKASGSSTASLDIKRSGTADNWITYKAYPGHSPLIQSNGAWQAVRIDGRYIIVDGFRVRGIRDQVSFDEAQQAFNNYRYNGAGMTARIHGSGITMSPFNIVRNNEVWNFGGGGIEVNGIDSIIIENNLVYDTSHYSPVGHSGISVIYSVNVDGTQTGLDGSGYKNIVRGNISHSNINYFPCSCYDYRAVTDGNGIIVDVQDGYNARTLVANNLVFNNGGSGIHTYRARNVDVINNTAYLNAQSEDIRGDLYSRRSENVNLINNIIYAKAGERVTSDNPGTNVYYAHNIYYDGTNSPIIPTGIGPNDIVANPQFINPSFDLNNADFRLASNSPGIDSGSSDYLPMTDINGAQRLSGATDRGAYENVAPPSIPTPTPPPAATPTPTLTPTPLLPPASTSTPTAIPTSTATPDSSSPVENVPIYTDSLAQGWQAGAWGDISSDLSNGSAPVHAGRASIALQYNETWGTYYLQSNQALDSDQYQALSFWVYGDAGGDSTLAVALLDSEYQTSLRARFPELAPGWQYINVPLASLGPLTDILYILLDNPLSSSQPALYIDDLVLESSDSGSLRAASSVRMIIEEAELAPAVQGHQQNITIYMPVMR